MKRPLYVWVVIFWLLWVALFSGLRLAGAVNAWNWLQKVGVSPGAGYIAVSGAVFMLALAVAALMLALRARGYVWVVRGVVLAYAVWYWADRLLFTRDDASRANWSFALVVTLLAVGYGFAVTVLEARRDGG